MWGWHWPHYDFEVTAEDGTALRRRSLRVVRLMGGRGPTITPSVKRGEGFEVPVEIPQILNPGKYRVRFSYEVREETSEDVSRDLNLEFPADTWFCDG